MKLGIPPTTRERFLAAIAERISPERVQALYLFAPIRQGPLETGVAVLACDPVHEPDVSALVARDPVVPTSVVPVPEPEAAEIVENASGEEIAPVAITVPPQLAPRIPTPNSSPIPRPVVLTARYCHTLKGADRGKWEFELHEQAEAPLATVERVIQGVQHRLDEPNEPELLGVDALRAARADGVWTPPAR